MFCSEVVRANWEYNYTPHLLDEKDNYEGYFENEDGYGYLALEQWGCDRTKKVYHVFICDYSGEYETSEIIPVDTSRGWETMRPSFDMAVRIFNSLAPAESAIPLF